MYSYHTIHQFLISTPNKCEYYFSVTFNDDDPKKGYAYLWLGVEGLEVKKIPLVGTAKPKNAEIVPEFKSE